MKSMFSQNTKKKPPPRPPPPNFLKYRSKSTLNLNQGKADLIEWSPPNSPRVDRYRQFGGSVSSSYSSSTSSLTSSKKSLESDSSLFSLNWTSNSSSVKPRIIRPPPPKFKSTNASPPMPNMPPPSPPKEKLNIVTPYGIALYDFPATQPGDLPLQVNDVVIILKRVGNEWLYGMVCDKEGIFPENFIKVEIPLPGEHQIVTALYEFNTQLPGDLAFKPGQKIKVTREISSEWLYGESEGKVGQFPKNFVS